MGEPRTSLTMPQPTVIAGERILTTAYEIHGFVRAFELLCFTQNDPAHFNDLGDVDSTTPLIPSFRVPTGSLQLLRGEADLSTRSAYSRVYVGLPRSTDQLESMRRKLEFPLSLWSPLDRLESRRLLQLGSLSFLLPVKVHTPSVELLVRLMHRTDLLSPLLNMTHDEVDARCTLDDDQRVRFVKEKGLSPLLGMTGVGMIPF